MIWRPVGDIIVNPLNQVDRGTIRLFYLDILKEAAVDSHRLWKASGKPRYGPIFDRKQQARLQYRKRIRKGKRF